MNSILPWHEKAWQHLVNQHNRGKLPHAILIKGMAGVGKLLFAKNLATLLLDHNYLVGSDNHPDLIMIQPEEAGKAIKIEQIRETIADLNNTSRYGGYRIAIIESAELLNIAAANALLKTLEEPAPQTIIILISSHPMLLSATIRSRCQTITIHSPNHKVAKAWLEKQLPDSDANLLLALTENAPLKALNFVESGKLLERQKFFGLLDDLWQKKISITSIVEHGLAWDLDDLMVIWLSLTTDLIKLKLNHAKNLINQDQLDRLVKFAAKLKLDKLLTYQDHLINLRRHLFNKINLNQQMVVENLMITWLQLLTRCQLSG